MGKTTGFKETRRKPPTRRAVADRITDYREFYEIWDEDSVQAQGGRCMDCSVPFCHSGCPLGNLIPDWNDLVYRGQWKKALAALHATNNFPEFTGRICPAPCEASCVLSINEEPVTIEYIEKAIADRGWDEDWIIPEPPGIRTGKKVAVIGSGPAGLAAAQQLNRSGHWITVFERSNEIGGLLRFGIPDFKLEKHVVQRRVDQMAAEGVSFKTGMHVGHNHPTRHLLDDFDAVCLAIGSTEARDLPVPGRELEGIHFAMEYLTQQNKLIAGELIDPSERITAEGKTVVILGGGDTGADCLGTAHRQGAKAVHQCEILAEPPTERSADNPWPQWPLVLRSSAAHDEGGIRDYAVLTKSFAGTGGTVKKLHAARVSWEPPDLSGRRSMEEQPDNNFELDADLVLLAMGFVHPEHNGVVGELGVELDARGNIKTNGNKMTSVPNVFAAGDASRGQSLVVWAIAEGREAAHCIDQHLMGTTRLPRAITTE